MEKQNHKIPIQMEFTIASIQEGIQFWLTNVVIKENIVVNEVIWNVNKQTFTISLANGIQVGEKL